MHTRFLTRILPFFFLCRTNPTTTALSGMPYWSEDIGGFFRPDDQYTSADYHDLLVR